MRTPPPDRIRNSRAQLSGRERVIFRWAVLIFLAIVLEGALRKWVLPASMQAVPYFAKDVLAGLFLLAYAQPKKVHLGGRLTPFIVGIVACLMPAFLMGLSKVPIGAIVVFKNAVLWPLFAIRMGAFLSERVQDKLWKFALICTVPMAALATAQYFAGPASLLNRYAWDDFAQFGGFATAGEFVRATGTFSYLAGLSSFSMAMFCLFLGRSLSAGYGRELAYAVAGLGAAMICGLASGSRSAQVFMATVTVLIAVLVPKKHGMRVIGGLLGVGLTVAVVWNSSISEGAVARWAASDREEIEWRITGTQVGQPILETLAANPSGLGLGLYSAISTHNGDNDDLPYNENASNRVAAEAGLLGVLATALGMGMILRAGHWTLATEDLQRKTRLLPIAVGALIQLALGMWYDHTASGLWWWTIGLWLADVAIVLPRRCSIRTATLQFAAK